MRLSGWMRIAIVFVVVMWGVGAWGLVRNGAPGLLPPAAGHECGGDLGCVMFAGQAALDWRSAWSRWVAEHPYDILFMFSRPILILLGLGLVLAALKWVVRGFAPRAPQSSYDAPASSGVVWKEEPPAGV